MISAHINHAVLLTPLADPLQGVADHDPKTNPQRSAIRQFLEKVDGLEGRSGILEAGDPLAQAFILCLANHTEFLRFDRFRGAIPVECRFRRRDQVFGIFQEYTDRLALCIAYNHPAGWIGRLPDNPGQFHCPGIGIGRMAVGAAQPYRVIRRRGTEIVMVGKPLYRGHIQIFPFFLMPSPPEDPTAGRLVCRRFPHQRHHLLPAADVAQIERHLEHPQFTGMGMAFDKAGNGQPTLQVDHPGVLADGSGNFLHTAHRRDPPVAYRQSGGFGEGFIDRDDFSVGQHQIGPGGLVGATA